MLPRNLGGKAEQKELKQRENHIRVCFGTAGSTIGKFMNESLIDVYTVIMIHIALF